MRAEQTFVSTTPELLQGMAKTAAMRHRGRCNALFCDGHVEQVENKSLFLDDSDYALRRWNKDNAPHR